MIETITPADAAAVAAAVAEAARTDAAVYPIGGGTALDYGARPTRTGVGVSLAKLNRVVDHPARDLTITVEAGLTIAALRKKLAAERQRLPVDIPQADRATVGGAVAASPSGPRRYRWSTMRDYVIGIHAVDGAGTEFSGGGRVVKNAAGYDLCRLLTGSLGTLAVITQVTLMVKPMADTAAVMACDLGDFDTAERLLAVMVRTDTLPVAIELLAGPAWRDDPALGPMTDGAVGRLVVGFEGSAPEVDWMLESLAGEWHQCGVANPITVPSAQVEPLYRRLTEFPVGTPEPDGSAPLVVQISVLPSATVAAVRRLREMMPECSLEVHAGNGVIRGRFAVAPDAAAAMLRERLRPLVTQAGGAMVVLAHPPDADLDVRSVWGPPGDGATVMRAIKERFDPKNLLNPGRFVY
ncbi:MAG: FAD-binding oxidoreductase [Planctomycetia bacterium]|nr:FAD-binding oxidoreductase [Planctomycetia bacterium]